MFGRDQNPDPPVGEQKQADGSGGKKESNVDVIAGSTVGGVVLLVALVVAVFVGKRKCGKFRKGDER